MSEHPIIVSGPMVRAILEGRKTQTRRVLTPQPYMDQAGNFCVRERNGLTTNWGQHMDGRPCVRNYVDARIKWRPGDDLWVRETWNCFILSRDGECSWPAATIPEDDPRKDDDMRNLAVVDYPVCPGPGTDGGRGPWRPSIHMPRWASRITLRVTDVRVERLQDITEAGAIAEGMIFDPPTEGDREWHRAQCEEYGEDPDKDPIQGVWLAAGTRRGYGLDQADREQPLWACTAREAFSMAWNALNAKRGHSWNANPWVSVTSFAMVKP